MAAIAPVCLYLDPIWIFAVGTIPGAVNTMDVEGCIFELAQVSLICQLLLHKYNKKKTVNCLRYFLIEVKYMQQLAKTLCVVSQLDSTQLNSTHSTQLNTALFQIAGRQSV